VAFDVLIVVMRKL